MSVCKIILLSIFVVSCSHTKEQDSPNFGTTRLADSGSLMVDADDLDEFWNAYKAVVWKYKPYVGKEGWYLGFMIQDIEKTKLGKTIVSENAQGVKIYDFQKFMGILATQVKRMHSHAAGSPKGKSKHNGDGDKEADKH